MEGTRVLVTGSTGMIGPSVVRRLLADEYRVRVLLRSERPMPNRVEIVRGSMTDAEALLMATKDVEIVVHLAAAKNDEMDTRAINVEGAKYLRQACEDQGVRHIVNISTQSAKLRKKGLYGGTKSEADAILQTSTVPVTTLMPSVVYTDHADGIIGSILGFAKFPVFPVIGPGTAQYRPMHSDDLAAIIAEAIRNPHVKGKTYDIGGPDCVSFDAFADQVLAEKGIRRTHVHIPIPMALVMAKIFSVLSHPPVTKSNVLGSAEDVPMDLQPFLKDFTVRPRTLREGLAFLRMPKNMTYIEAVVLLHYVLPDAGTATPALIERYQAALKAHGIDAHQTISDEALASPSLLGAADCATKLMRKESVLQKKLLVAAAIMECQPGSAQALLPHTRSIVVVIADLAGASLMSLWKGLCALLLLCVPSLLSRHAGPR